MGRALTVIWRQANAGAGIRLPRALKPLLQIVLPILIVLIIVQGLI